MKRFQFPRLLLLSCFIHTGAFALVGLEQQSEAPVLTGDLTVTLVPIQEHTEEAPAEPQPEVLPPPPPPPPEPVKEIAIEKPKKKKPEPPKEVVRQEPKPEVQPEQVAKAPQPAYPAPVKGTPQLGERKVSPIIKANYKSQVLAWLERHKKYPRAARRQGLEGEALVRISISRSGEVLMSRVEKSTGESVLDQAVEQMVARANPFPPMPENFPGENLEFRVPIRFDLR